MIRLLRYLKPAFIIVNSIQHVFVVNLHILTVMGIKYTFMRLLTFRDQMEVVAAVVILLEKIDLSQSCPVLATEWLFPYPI